MRLSIVVVFHVLFFHLYCGSHGLQLGLDVVQFGALGLPHMLDFFEDVHEGDIGIVFLLLRLDCHQEHVFPLLHHFLLVQVIEVEVVGDDLCLGLKLQGVGHRLESRVRFGNNSNK